MLELSLRPASPPNSSQAPRQQGDRRRFRNWCRSRESGDVECPVAVRADAVKTDASLEDAARQVEEPVTQVANAEIQSHRDVCGVRKDDRVVPRRE